MYGMCNCHRGDRFQPLRNPVRLRLCHRHHRTRSDEQKTEAADFQRWRRGFGLRRTKLHDRHKIKEWILFVCERNNAEQLAKIIIVEWNSRFTRRMGDAIYSPISMRARIRLSLPLWPRASAQDRRETVIHETCHCVVGYKHGYAASAHGSAWKKAMQNCGVEPIRLHSVDRAGLIRRRRLFILLPLSQRRHRKKVPLHNQRV